MGGAVAGDRAPATWGPGTAAEEAAPPCFCYNAPGSRLRSQGLRSRFPTVFERQTVASRFGPFVLDRERRQLFENGAEVHLSPKAYALLTTLIDASPKAVSKADLLERLWPGTFVLDASLTVLTAEVRKALGDMGRHGPFIRTVHSFGYAFDGDVIEDSNAHVPGPPPSSGRRCWIDLRRSRDDPGPRGIRHRAR